MDQKKFDGRNNFPADNKIESALEEHFERFGISRTEIWKNFPVYTRRTYLKRFLAHYELFRMTRDLPGDIVELGVYRGASLMSWANFMEIRNMGDRHKKVIGFDNFSGFTELEKKDGAADPHVGKENGGFDSSNYETQLREAIRIFDADRFIPYKKRVHLIKGDIETTIPKYIKNNPGTRISLLHFDADLYRPTSVALKHLWSLVVPEGIIAFDEYGIPPWEGESKAVDEFLENNNISVKLQRFDWCSNPGAFIIK